ncbi:MAG TPA: hypothetical protein VG015_01120 [Candidatus Dormibacteraeota bacterium]|jgi:hypothetical protein|nr:hypothetical protein [Candidatus Dormibacteraeota bacterium]
MGRTRTEDLHGYDRLTAVDLALVRVREAYLNGYAEIELIHGSANVTAPPAGKRGGIKWELRQMLEEGSFDGYCERDLCWERAGSLQLRLKPNGRPRPESWSPAPPKTHR